MRVSQEILTTITKKIMMKWSSFQVNKKGRNVQIGDSVERRFTSEKSERSERNSISKDHDWHCSLKCYCILDKAGERGMLNDMRGTLILV